MEKFSTPPRIIESPSTQHSLRSEEIQPNVDCIMYKGRQYKSATQALNDYIREYDGTRLKTISQDVLEVNVYFKHLNHYYLF